MTLSPLRILVLTLLVGAPVSLSAQTPPRTLYQRIGGYDMLAKITDGLLLRFRTDPMIGPVVSSLAASSRQRNRQLIVDQLCNETGGPCLYIGRSMAASHQGLGITDEMWERMLKLLSETLTELKIQEPERSDFTEVIQRLQYEIVERPKQ